MEEMNEAQKQLMRKRQEMLAKMGVPRAGTMVNESIVNSGSQATGMAAKLAAIRNGSAKAELNKFIQATGKNVDAPGGAQSFQAIPEHKPKKRPNQPGQEVKPEYRQELADFGGPQVTNSYEMQELNAIDSLFGGDSRASVGGNSYAQAPMDTKLDIESAMMPSFNPQAALQQKAKARQSQQETPSPYLQYANDSSPVQEEFVPVNGQNFNPYQLQTMMETIAKGVAEKTIRTVLNEYSEQQKNKNYFEFYNKEKNIIKTIDGKYYRLTELKKK